MGDRKFQRFRGINDPDLAPYLDYQRQLRGWSVRELAQRAGLSRAAVAAILRGDSRPEPATLIRLTGALAAVRPHAPTKQAFQEIEQAALAPG